MYGPAALRSVAVAVAFAATPVPTTVGPPTVLFIGVVCGIAVWNGWTAEGFVERGWEADVSALSIDEGISVHLFSSRQRAETSQLRQERLCPSVNYSL
jgi:hypothetical protein